MHPLNALPQAPAAAGIDLAVDRRRPGRAEAVPPALVPLLRGQFDENAPADPAVLQHAGRMSARELVFGGGAIAGLLLIGAALRFAVV